ncbi:polymer-forming cytoskeletal protein [Paenibacillus sp. J5C_2022]|uniref:bactofilin family protein n=1 Tax=Paenibacillus sp. J5C2022 TaxID=2977129 RepID=UPI0021CFA726|nr:polymer-forming cytoskeletal protein [Paenibacillus sp. J5C2022]MCU6709191.1 polymer-forming cytoskeletal protein [Paenibacillus sp. J5C2022]
MFKENRRNASTDTLIGAGTVAEGKLTSEANLRIEGEYRGEIACKGAVIIGEQGVAHSNISAQDVTLAGKVYGDIVTTGRLIITSSGHITGNIMANHLIIQEGGMINGSCHMEPPASEAKPSHEKESATASGKQDSKANEERSRSKQAV